jgi:cytochrome c biogenesis protein CcmG/thiol:disulfide interchange protein DsbE
MPEQVAATAPAAIEGSPGGRRPRSRIAPFVAIGIAVVFALLFYVFARSDSSEPDSADTPLMFQPAPETRGAIETADGGQATFDLARRRGSWVVLNFFDSTCGPCVAEHPELVAFEATQRARGADGAELVTIVWGEHPDGARSFFADNGGDWPVVFDDGGQIATDYGVTKVPETWIVNPDGFVVQRYISEVTADFLNSQIAAMQGDDT